MENLLKYNFIINYYSLCVSKNIVYESYLKNQTNNIYNVFW
jgi:hypothetical protein